MEAGACGMTVTRVRGCGERMDFFRNDWMVSHARIEVFTSTNLADQIAQAIVDSAHTGAEGDGIVAIQPVQRIYRIRTKACGVPDSL
jgi:nitrogen regulatory protein P-II 1